MKKIKEFWPIALLLACLGIIIWRVVVNEIESVNCSARGGVPVRSSAGGTGCVPALK